MVTNETRLGPSGVGRSIGFAPEVLGERRIQHHGGAHCQSGGLVVLLMSGLLTNERSYVVAVRAAAALLTISMGVAICVLFVVIIGMGLAPLSGFGSHPRRNWVKAAGALTTTARGVLSATRSVGLSVFCHVAACVGQEKSSTRGLMVQPGTTQCPVKCTDQWS